MRASGARPILGIIVTHDQLGDELLRTAESILGPQERIVVKSNRGHSHKALIGEVNSLIDQLAGKEEPVVLFADLHGGSCGHACSAAAASNGRVLVACGVNLPMLLEFLFHRGRVGLSELKSRMVCKGRQEIRCSGWDNEA
ncbi:MAG: hypothetical protein KAY24_06110 [Candidatus Eisenbacteria sp.]|nr:hypothetical protein [Candidatus Eisenbacteria bacterium]